MIPREAKGGESFQRGTCDQLVSKAIGRSWKVRTEKYPLDLAVRTSLVTLARAVSEIVGIEARLQWVRLYGK